MELIDQNNYINNFNKEIIKNNENINIIDYALKLNNTEIDKVNLRFMDKFINIVDRSDFCINATDIYDLGIFANLEKKSITGKNKGFSSSNFHKDMLKDKYLENIDYKKGEKVSNLGQIKKTYMLTPTCFKLILIRNKNTNEYAKYYLFLERVVKYYSKFQKLKIQIKMKNS